jgi:ABC-type transporter Mla MlaB component
MLKPTSNGFRIEGAVNFGNVAALHRVGAQWIRAHESAHSFVIDLSDMQDQDASSFALLLSWHRLAQKNKLSFSLEHVPVSMQKMSHLFGLSNLL